MLLPNGLSDIPSWQDGEADAAVHGEQETLEVFY